MSRLTGRCARTCARNFACWSNASYASTATRPTSRRKRRRRYSNMPKFCLPGGRRESMSAFARFIGIDYSGAATPISKPEGPVHLSGRRQRTAGRGPAATVSAQKLDPARHCRMAGGTAGRGCAHSGRHRPWVFAPASAARKHQNQRQDMNRRSESRRAARAGQFMIDQAANTRRSQPRT